MKWTSEAPPAIQGWGFWAFLAWLDFWVSGGANRTFTWTHEGTWKCRFDLRLPGASHDGADLLDTPTVRVCDACFGFAGIAIPEETTARTLKHHALSWPCCGQSARELRRHLTVETRQAVIGAQGDLALRSRMPAFDTRPRDWKRPRREVSSAGCGPRLCWLRGNSCPQRGLWNGRRCGRYRDD